MKPDHRYLVVGFLPRDGEQLLVLGSQHCYLLGGKMDGNEHAPFPQSGAWRFSSPRHFELTSHVAPDTQLEVLGRHRDGYLVRPAVPPYPIKLYLGMWCWDASLPPCRLRNELYANPHSSR